MNYYRRDNEPVMMIGFGSRDLPNRDRRLVPHHRLPPGPSQFAGSVSRKRCTLPSLIARYQSPWCLVLLYYPLKHSAGKHCTIKPVITSSSTGYTKTKKNASITDCFISLYYHTVYVPSTGQQKNSPFSLPESSREGTTANKTLFSPNRYDISIKRRKKTSAIRSL